MCDSHEIELHTELDRLRAAYDSRGGEMDSMRMVLAETQKWNEDRMAEIERHQAVRKVVEQENDELRTCNSRQRAEIERLRADLESGMERFYSQMAELDNAKAEIKQLKADRTALVEHGWKLERENDGLRAALPRHPRRALENKP